MLKRMKQLVEELNEAARVYYQEDGQVMSDNEYDKFYDELLELEKQTGVILSNSPTQKVGYTVLSNLTKVSHEKKMLSLDKTKEREKLQSWLEEQTGLLSWKMDGLTIVLKYLNGVLEQAVTRGNGEIGEDVTHNAKVFKNVPLHIDFDGELILRGEAVIAYSEFEKINESLELEKQYKNPRNLCSGTVRQLNSEVAAERNVMFYAFTLVKAEDKEFKYKSEQLAWLNKLGFDVVESKLVNKTNIIEMVAWFSENIEKNDFPSDGLVLSYDDIEYGNSLGSTAKFPRDAIAFKWADEMAETKILEVVWNTSRTGRINPIAVFEPVELEGTTVNRASVHNISIIEDMKLGIGDIVKVYKANMIIPQIAENLTKKGGLDIPQKCPVCSYETEVRQLREGKTLYCNNPNCKAQLIRSLEHFVSRDAMNVEGLSEATLEKFVEKGFLKDYTNIFELKKYEKDIVAMEGFGEKSCKNLLDAIEKSRNISLPNFIYALGISNVGLSNAKLLCKKFDNNLDLISNANQDEFVDIEGFGEIIAHELYKYFHDCTNLELLNKVLGFLNFENIEKVSSNILLGKTFVITGDVYKFKNRRELQEKIEQLGGKVSSSVSTKTSYLINNDNNSSSSKNKKANELGIDIITEDEFIQRFQ